jgi:hypothetical protein
MAEMRLSDWWPQEDSLREWRRLLNEIQMVWHTHPVNLARAERGEVPINSLWLFGGAKGWSPNQVAEKPGLQDHAQTSPQIKPQRQTPMTVTSRPAAQTPADNLASALTYEGLHTPYLQGDWAAWIAALPALSEHLSTLDRNTHLTLTGQQRDVVLKPTRKLWWHILIAPRPQPWNTWWNLPN